jgi:hypothetical protein
LVALGQAAVIDTSKMDVETTTLDLAAATEEQLKLALFDCIHTYAFEYPETERGTYAALRRADEIRAEYNRRDVAIPEWKDPRDMCRRSRRW